MLQPKCRAAEQVSFMAALWLTMYNSVGWDHALGLLVLGRSPQPQLSPGR